MIRVLLSFLIFLCGEPFTANAQETESISLQELVVELEGFAQSTLESSGIYRHEFNQLSELHGVANNKKNYRDFVRVKLIFEATRDSGLWNIVWQVTD